MWLAHHGRDALVARYGKARLQQVFLQILKTKGCRVPAGWDIAEYGAGIVDAHALLREPLPVASAVRGPRRAAPSAFDPYQRIRALFPELGEEDLRQRLIDLLGGTDRTLRRRLERFGAEVAYLLTEDLQTRSAFVGARGRRASARAAGSPLHQTMVRSASRSFVQGVGLV